MKNTDILILELLYSPTLALIPLVWKLVFIESPNLICSTHFQVAINQCWYLVQMPMEFGLVEVPARQLLLCCVTNFSIPHISIRWVSYFDDMTPMSAPVQCGLDNNKLLQKGCRMNFFFCSGLLGRRRHNFWWVEWLKLIVQESKLCSHASAVQSGILIFAFLGLL